jgi:cellulose biosynthesis protein BcsQ
MEHVVDRAALDRTIALINGKGGVLKTTLTSNVGGLLAASGYRVLVVDMDPQGNLGIDLGYARTQIDDQGRALAAALMFGSGIEPLATQRENLFVVPGGAHLDKAAAGLFAQGQKDPGGAKLSLAKGLSPIAADFEMILIDCPPGNESLQIAALGAAAWAVVPTHTDKASREGLVSVAERLDTVTDVNPELDLLGVVLTATTTGATAVRREARDKIAEAFGTGEVLFDSSVRFAEATATAMRERGLLAHELEKSVKDGPKWYEVVRGAASAIAGPRSAGGVAEDLHRVAQELVARLANAETQKVSA